MKGMNDTLELCEARTDWKRTMGKRDNRPTGSGSTGGELREGRPGETRCDRQGSMDITKRLGWRLEVPAVADHYGTWRWE